MCAFDGCVNPIRAKGLCGTHYNQQHRGKPLTPIDRLSKLPHTKRDKVEYLEELKSKPCSDCNQVFPTECMDFDHIPEKGEKKFLLNNGAFPRLSWDKIHEELAKCELVCSNCHRIRTRNRKMASIRLCQEPGCDNKHSALGYCSKCYAIYRKSTRSKEAGTQ